MVDLGRMEEVMFKFRGCFDFCIVLKVFLVVESFVVFVIVDYFLRRRVWEGMVR